MQEKSIPGPWPMDATIQSLLRIEIYNKTNHFWAYLHPALVWQEQLPTSAVGYEQSGGRHGPPEGRGHGRLLDGRWLCWAISHTLCYSAPASSDFQIQTKQVQNWLEMFSYPSHQYLHMYTGAWEGTACIQRLSLGIHSIRSCWRRG